MANKTLMNPIPNRSAKPTIAQIRDRILADAELEKVKSIAAAGALVSVARACGMPLETMPADPRLIGEKLKGFAPAQIGLAEGTWKTRLSLVRFAFRRTGVMKEPARQIERFAPEWTKVMRLPTMKNELIGLSRFARFCSTKGIDPDAVDDLVFDAFLDDLQNNQIIKQAQKAHRRATQIWNQLADTTPNWPSRRVTVPSYSKTYAIEWNRFPPSLAADVGAHLAQLDGSDPLASLDVRPLKPSSIRTRRYQLHILVSAIVLSGEDSSRFAMLADVMKPDMVRKGLRYLLDRVGGATAQAHDVARTAVAVARHWVKAPEAELQQLAAMCKRLDGGGGMSKSNRDRLRQFNNPENVRKLLHLPAALVAKVRRREGRPTEAEALLVQTALIIEMLLMIPIRRHNMAALDIQKHFVRPADGGVFLWIDGSEVKNGVDIDARLVADTVKLLDLYLKVYRPILAPEPTNVWLFPGLKGRAKCRERVAYQVSDTIKRELGLQVHMHLFRHIAAKLYLDQHPGGYGVVQRLHGHKSINTTIGTYCGAETPSSVAQYDGVILGLRQ